MSQWHSFIKALKKQAQIQWKEMTCKLFWLMMKWVATEESALVTWIKATYKSLIYISYAYDTPGLPRTQIIYMKRPKLCW